ncbi:MAG: hypothetical protein GY772_29520 [bacterium]|nr:hypothetical protein [bacterium]
MTVAPLARSAVTTINGICPFSHAQDGVVGDPNPNLVRSLWAYDATKQTLPEVVDSMVRVSSFESALQAGETPSGPPLPPEMIPIYCDQARRSAMSTRFTLYPNAFTDEQDPRDDPQVGNGDYDEKAFIAIMAPLKRLVEPSDFFAVQPAADPFVVICVAQALNFQFQAYNAVSMADQTGSIWFPGASAASYPFNGALSPYSPPAGSPTFPNIFVNDGTDGTPPVPVAQGRTPAQVVEYAAANSDQLYIGFTFTGGATGGNATTLIDISVGHSTAPVTA